LGKSSNILLKKRVNLSLLPQGLDFSGVIAMIIVLSNGS
jgi:hypothetical protein